MAKVTFKNPLDQELKFKEVYDPTDLMIPIIYSYARESHDDIYNAVLNKKVSIYVNDKIIETDDWSSYKVTDSDEIIVTPAVEGNAMGWVMVAIGVILIAVSIFVPPAGIAGISALQIGLAGAAIALSGLSQLLFRPDLPNLPTMRGMDQSQSYSWSGISTSARVGAPIPVVYGTHAVGGNIISGFTIRNGVNDYLYMLIALGEGEIDGIVQLNDYGTVCETSDSSAYNYAPPAIFLDDQPLTHYENVQWWYRKGTNTASPVHDANDPNYQNIIPYFSGATTQVSDGRQLDSDGIIYTTSKEVDRVSVQVQAPSMYSASGGSVNAKSATFYIKYRVNGTDTWYQYEERHWSTKVTAGPGITLGYTGGVTSIDYYQPTPDIDIRIIRVYSTNILDDFWQFVTRWNAENWYWACYYGRSNCHRHYDGKKWRGLGWYDSSNTKVYKIEFDIYDYWENTTTRKETYITVHKTEVQVVKFDQAAYEAWVSGVQAVTPDVPILPFGRPAQFYYWATETRLTFTPQWITYKGHRFCFGNQFSGYTAYNHANKQTWWGISKVHAGDVIEIRNTFTSVTGFTISGVTKSGLWRTVDIDFGTGAPGMVGKEKYDLLVYRSGNRTTDMQAEDNLILNAVTETIDGPFIYPNTALLGLRVRASEQLSGGLPNIVTVIRGCKVEVPDTRLTASPVNEVVFQDCYYAKSTDTWERISDSAAVQWDETTFRTGTDKEWSNNPMLTTRDLLLHKRYGLGDYIRPVDIYTDSVVTTIKECHATWVPENKDYMAWWDAGDVRSFDMNVSVRTTSVASLTYVDSTNEKVILGGANIQTLDFKLDRALDRTIPYVLSVTLSGLSMNVDLRGYVWSGTGWSDLGKFAANVGNGTHSTSAWYPTTTQHTRIRLVVDSYGSDTVFQGQITDVSVNPQGNKETMHYHTWDGVYDRQQAAMSCLLETCDGYRTWPTWFGGKFGFIYERNETPIHTISVGNCIEFSQSWLPLSDIPYRMIGQFTDETKKWEMSQLIAQQTAAQDLIKINEMVLGLKGITNMKRAERELKFKLNKITNITHTVQLKAGVDAIHATAGDIVFVQDDLPSWGTGGRVLDYTSSINQIVIDKSVTLASPSGGNYVIRYQTGANQTLTASLDPSYYSPGEATQFIYVKSWPAVDPASDAVFAFGNINTYVKKFRVMSAVRTNEETVELSGAEHLDALYEPNREIMIIYDVDTELPNPNARPLEPVNTTVRPLDRDIGIGFDLNARTDPEETARIDGILIKWKPSDADIDDYTDLTMITPGNNTYRYINNNMVPGYGYTFRFIVKGSNGRLSDPIDVEGVLPLESTLQTAQPQSNETTAFIVRGMRVKGSNANATYFDGRDLSLEWNEMVPPGGSTQLIDGYRLYLYYGNTLATRLLREVDIKNNYFTYTYNMMLEDTGGKIVGMTATPMVIIAHGKLPTGQLSQPSLPFRVHNKRPDPVSNVTPHGTPTGVKFEWDASLDDDHYRYQLKVKVESDPTWKALQEIDTNSYLYSLTATDITNYGDDANVYIRVRDVDYHLQKSATFIEAVGVSRTLAPSDNFFQIEATQMGGTFTSGYPASLYDGDLDSGGVTII